MTPDDDIQDDCLSLTTAACRCAGKLTISLATGGKGAALIYPTGELSAEGKRRWSSFFAGDETPVVAVAGLVAEYWAECRERHSTEVLQLIEADWESIRSSNVGQSMPFEPLEHLVHYSLNLLQENCKYFSATVDQLIGELYVSEHQSQSHFGKWYMRNDV